MMMVAHAERWAPHQQLAGSERRRCHEFRRSMRPVVMSLILTVTLTLTLLNIPFMGNA
jgi:hypothetical protein